MDTNDALADISELNGERKSETNSESDSSWHDDSDSAIQFTVEKFDFKCFNGND